MSSVEQAVQQRSLDPSRSLRSFAGEGIARSTLHDRETGKHAPRGTLGTRLLSVAQEGVLLDKINEGAARGTLLTPRQLHEIAQRITGQRPGKNWGSEFIARHKQKIVAKYFTIQEVARINADTPETRRAFYDLVSN